MCISLVIQERAAAAVSVAANLPFAPMLSPPQFFADTVIKFSSRLMHVLKDQCSLKELCGNLVNVGSPARTEKIFVRLVLPTCIRLGSGRSGEFTTRASTFWQSHLKEIVFTTEVQVMFFAFPGPKRTLPFSNILQNWEGHRRRISDVLNVLSVAKRIEGIVIAPVWIQSIHFRVSWFVRVSFFFNRGNGFSLF